MGLLCGLAAGVIKYLMFAANVLFMLSGVGIVVLGTIMQQNFQDFDKLLQGTFSGTAIAIIVIGSLIIVIGFCGCCGAIRKNVCLLHIYSVLLLLVFIAEIAIGVVALLQVGDTQEFMTDNFLKFFKDEYQPEPHESELFDILHKKFECCLVDGPKDIDLITGMSDPPASCKCSSGTVGDQSKCGQSFDSHPGYYKSGCNDEFTTWLEDGVQAVGIVSLCVAACEVVAIVFACCLAARFKKQKAGGD